MSMSPTAVGGRLGLGLALSLAAYTAAQAQTAEPLQVASAEVSAPSTTQIYDQTFFGQYDLSTAEDILRRIPGVATLLDRTSGGQSRGLGAGTEQIIINGQRMASKSDSAAATLRRIPAASVERVELIRGSSTEVQSEGLLVNVVLKAGVELGGTGAFEAAYRFNDRGWSDVDGLISYASTWGALSYVVGYEKASWSPVGLLPGQGGADWSVRSREERYLYPTGEVMELRPQKWAREYQRHTFTANTTYAFANGDSVRFNVLYQPNPIKQVDRSRLTRFSLDGLPASGAREEHYNKQRTDTFEFGGELETAIGPGALTVIGLHTREQVTTFDFRNRTEDTGALVELGRNLNDQHTGEDVVRASYEWPVTESQTLSFGAEGARNFLTQQIEVFFDLNRDGRLEAIDIPTAFARVAEKRGELFVTHNWRINSKLTLDTALYFEISQITTNYPAIPVRTLKYLKPRFDLTYNLGPRDRLRAKVERTVSQLGFGNFVPSYNVIDLRIDLGNPLIVPTKMLIYEAAYEHRLPNDNGTLNLRGFYRDTRGGVTFVPFGFNSAGLPISARGNAGKSSLYGLEGTASLRLGFLGVRDAQLNARVLRNWSGVIDLFTGEKRKSISAWNNEFSLGFRHDLTAWRASYGVSYLNTTGFQLVSNVRNFEYFSRGPRVSAFFEKSLWGAYSLRFDAYNINGAEEQRRRLIYRISQADGTLSRTEAYTEFRDRRFSLTLRGKF